MRDSIGASVLLSRPAARGGPVGFPWPPSGGSPFGAGLLAVLLVADFRRPGQAAAAPWPVKGQAIGAGRLASAPVGRAPTAARAAM